MVDLDPMGGLVGGGHIGYLEPLCVEAGTQQLLVDLATWHEMYGNDPLRWGSGEEGPVR